MSCPKLHYWLFVQLSSLEAYNAEDWKALTRSESLCLSVGPSVGHSVSFFLSINLISWKPSTWSFSHYLHLRIIKVNFGGDTTIAPNHSSSLSLVSFVSTTTTYVLSAVPVVRHRDVVFCKATLLTGTGDSAIYSLWRYQDIFDTLQYMILGKVRRFRNIHDWMQSTMVWILPAVDNISWYTSLCIVRRTQLQSGNMSHSE